jgi:hypothetical protein
MKKTLVIAIIITLILGFSLVSIPKHEVPTDTEWEAFLTWEEEFLNYRNGPALEECIYQIQHRDTCEVYFHGTLQECKGIIKHYELTKGECIIMPYLPL